jgi:hypothetical protein
LYKRKCDLCGKEIISVFAPERMFKVYCQPCWWSDRWDPLDYGREYNFSQPFFEQYARLFDTVPKVSAFNDYMTLVNSPYVNMTSQSKNCYLTSHADHNEDCSYASGLKFSKDCLDVTMVQKSEFVYDSLNIVQGYRNFYCMDCENSNGIYFSKNLAGCHDCFGCVNLRNKSYYIFNQPRTKEQYARQLQNFNLGSYRSMLPLREKTFALWKNFPNKYYHGFQNHNVSGDYVYHSKNTFSSYEMIETEDCKYCQFLSTKMSKDCYDYTEWGENASLVYESLVSGIGINAVKFSSTVYNNSHDVEYSFYLSDCQYVFGCAGLRHNKYCILNKQYSEAEYKALREQIIRHMNEMPYRDKKGRIYRYGEFLPAELSPFAYNETAYEFFPLSRKEALARGYSWRDREEHQYEITIKAENLPDNIKDVKDCILNEVIGCTHYRGPASIVTCNEQCTTAFRIIPQEIEFYRKMNLPLPRLCPNCRHHQRIKQRNPLKLWRRKCQCGGGKSDGGVYQNQTIHFHGSNPCPNEFGTSYAPEKPEIVYCERCYQGEVV